MAEIQIERKTPSTGLWILGLVLLGLVIWGVFEWLDRDRETAPLAAAQAIVTPAAAPAAAPAVAPAVTVPVAGMVAVDPTPLTDLAVIVVPQRLPLVGRTVRLVGVSVLSVPGDSVFWVGTDAAHRIMVVLDETLPSGASTDAWMNVNPGQRVNITGVIRPLPTDMAPWRARFGFTAADLDALHRDAVYLAANKVVITGA